MQGWVGVLPLLTAALAATIPLAPDASSNRQGAPDATWSLEDAADFFNHKTNFDYLYRLEETDASGALVRPGRMQFTVKETACLKSEARSIEDCKFKEGGAVKNCTAFLPEDPKTDEIVISCDSPVSKRTRLRRADLLKEGFEGINVPVNEFHDSPGSSLSHEWAPDVIASFGLVDEIDETYEGILFGDSIEGHEESFRIVKKNRFPFVEPHEKARFRIHRVQPWTWGLIRRGGRYNSI